MLIEKVSAASFPDALDVYIASWRESHRSMCSADFLEKRDYAGCLQKKIDASLVDEVTNILVYKTKLFLEYAEIVGGTIKDSGYISPVSGLRNIFFEYKGYVFDTFVTEEEYEQIKEKVLPPTKVTEPNKNNE